MTLQSRIDTGGYPHEHRNPWSTPPEQITLGHGHHIQPIANSLARRLGASEDGTADAPLVHRISPRRSNLLSRIQGCEMRDDDDDDANINGNGMEREEERALNSEQASISPFVSLTITATQTSQNATKTLRHSATPTAQMSPGPSHQKRILHEDSVPPRSTPSNRSSQIHTDISRTTLTSAISRNAKLRRGDDTGGLRDKVNAVVTNEINEVFRNTLQKAQAELSEKQAAVTDDESPASAFLKDLLPSLTEETKSRSQSLVPSTESERPKHLPAAPKAMLTSPSVRLVESMLQAGADLTLPDEEPDTIMHATRMSRPSSSYHRKDKPSLPVRSDIPVAIGPVHPAPSLTKDLLIMTGAAAHTEGVELVAETTLIRLPGETVTTPVIVALHLSTSQQDMIEDAKIPKALGVHTANHYRQNEESDPTVIPNGYQKSILNTTWCMMNQNLCPISMAFPMSRGCGLFSSLGIFQTFWNTLSMSARKLLRNGTSQESAYFHLHVTRKPS
ncbi:hypothetical protein EDD85DRAFT_791456 [Armillaria nabsnona]|nr:hypothetical protein EDD85DRAFT_791456 [Armillaria nabsnona]